MKASLSMRRDQVRPGKSVLQTFQELIVHRERRCRFIASFAHQDQVHAAFSPDGCAILTASWDKTVKLWDAASDKHMVISFMRFRLARGV
jgi:WD40 repeat protein